ncbi:MAG: magnesium and cobalt transport protein CorA [Patulibacter sp.]
MHAGAQGRVIWATYRGGRPLADVPAGTSTAAGTDDLQLVFAKHPSESQIEQIGEQLGCDPRAVAQLHRSQERARADHYGNTRSLTVRPARYDDATETVQFGQLQVLVCERGVALLLRSGPFDLHLFRERLEGKPEVLAAGAASVLHATLDAVVDGYEPVIEGLENDIDEIETEVFDDVDADPLRRIYELIREVMSFQRATDPLEYLLDELLRSRAHSEDEERYLRDAHDRARRASQRAAAFRALLENALNAYLSLATKRLSEITFEQGEQTKKISSWAAIFVAPTVVAGIYGMNFKHMPELGWSLGYPFSIVLMVVLCVALYLNFKARDWL